MAVVANPDLAALPHDDARHSIRQFSQKWVAVLIASDLLMFVISMFTAGVFVKAFWLPTVSLQGLVGPGLLTAGCAGLVFAELGLYRRSFALSVRDEFYHAVAALSIASIPPLLFFSFFPMLSTSRAVVVVCAGFAIVLVGSARGVIHKVRDASAMAHPRRIAVIGEPSRLDFAEDAMRSLPNGRVFRLAVSNLDGLHAINADAVASLVWFCQAVSWGCDTLVFTEILSPTLMPHLLGAAERHGMTIAFAPPRIRVQAYNLSLETVGKQALIVAQPLRATRPAARLWKRIFDVTASSIALALFAPIMLLVAAAIAIEDGEPIVYRQERVGQDGKIFRILKFRSMRSDAERGGATLATVGDSRTTRVGRFIRRTSLDELPQLINVLRGDMSIVGPRPERPVFVSQFEKQYPRYAERHLVPPGITGWAQVYGKRVVGFDDVPEKLRADLFYVENWSLFMDLAVCLKTAAEVLFHRAA